VNRRRVAICNVAVLALAGLGGCGDQSPELTVADLSPGEMRYVTRFVTLERARAVALASPELSDALFDSLATAWGDTTAASVQAELPVEPARAAAVHDLLRRILKAEEDSLVRAPLVRRLAAPLPDPEPEKPQRPTG
jgi:hypothetical protein